MKLGKAPWSQLGHYNLEGNIVGFLDANGENGISIVVDVDAARGQKNAPSHNSLTIAYNGSSENVVSTDTTITLMMVVMHYLLV